MGFDAKELSRFLHSATKGTYRDVRKVLGMKLLKGEAMGKHVDNLGNPYTSPFNRKFSACPLWHCFKIFHSISILAIRPEKVK
jgi:hypothetical protein